MIKVNDFAVDLIQTGKGFKEIKNIFKQVYGANTIKNTNIFDNLKKV